MVSLKELQALLPDCCQADAVELSCFTAEEQSALEKFLPDAKSCIVLAHHVKHALEWVWFPFEASRTGSLPPADLHLQLEAHKLMSVLENKGACTSLLPYPGKIGIRFKMIADKTGMGKIGDDFLFLHKEWGHWVHLRVILTDAELADTLEPCEEVCIHCGACLNACPAHAIREDTLLGNVCSEYQNEIGKGITAYEYECEICLRACPIGKAPKQVRITEME